MSVTSSGRSSRLIWGGALLAVVAIAVISWAPTLSAHRNIFSRFTYNKDAYPILRERCGSCHMPGGVGPMSLLSYQEAFPWAQAIKEEVLGLRMPPWPVVDGGTAVKAPHALSAREMDVLVDWANGGTPEGESPKIPAPSDVTPEWSFGAPDALLTPSADFTLDKDTIQASRVFVIPTGLTADRFLRAIDIKPGNAAIVREVNVLLSPPGRRLEPSSEGGQPGVPEEESGLEEGQTLAVWTPGQTPITLPDDFGLRLPAKSAIAIRVRYKKTWSYESKTLSDRTSVGLYFTPRAPRSVVESLDVGGVLSAARSNDAGVVWTRAIDRDVRVLAMRPDITGVDLKSLTLTLVRADGTREELVRLAQPRADWPAPLTLEAPLDLQRGAQLELSATVDPEALPRSTPGKAADQAVRLTLAVAPTVGGKRTGSQARH